VGILPHFRAFSTPEQNPAPKPLSTPAPPAANASRWLASRKIEKRKT